MRCERKKWRADEAEEEEGEEEEDNASCCVGALLRKKKNGPGENEKSGLFSFALSSGAGRDSR